MVDSMMSLSVFHAEEKAEIECEDRSPAKRQGRLASMAVLYLLLQRSKGLHHFPSKPLSYTKETKSKNLTLSNNMQMDC